MDKLGKDETRIENGPEEGSNMTTPELDNWTYYSTCR